MSELMYENPFVHITELALSVLGIHKFIMGGRFGQICSVSGDEEGGRGLELAVYF
jgi:hypothetical protein